ncbi:hypothetical protein ACQEU3_13725 [Spirillospora sp. CA-253888]
MVRLPWLPRKPGTGTFVYRLLLAVDLEQYSRLLPQQQLIAQTDLRRLLDDCARRTGLGPDGWYRQVGGDGELVVLPTDSDVLRAVGPFTRRLEEALADRNRYRLDTPRLRMRMALHHGPLLIEGPLGPAGDPPIVVARLLDSAPLRRHLADHPDRDLALVVSDSLYQDVVRSGFCELDPAAFTALEVETKGRLYRGHIHDADAPLASERTMALRTGG